MEDALIALDFRLRPHGFRRIVGEFHRRSAIGRNDLADDGDRIERAIGRKAAEVVGEKRAPAITDAHAAAEMSVDPLDHIHVETIGKDRELLLRILPTLLPPRYGL